MRTKVIHKTVSTRLFLQHWRPLDVSADNGDDVVGEGVIQMSGQVGHRAVLRDVRLYEESEQGEEGEASVLDLLHLEESELVRVVCNGNDTLLRTINKEQQTEENPFCKNCAANLSDARTVENESVSSVKSRLLFQECDTLAMDAGT